MQGCIWVITLCDEHGEPQERDHVIHEDADQTRDDLIEKFDQMMASYMEGLDEDEG